MTYQAWTKEETEEYRKRRNPDIILRLTYALYKIPVDKPEKRAKLLAEDLLNLTPSDHDTFMRNAKEKGRVEQLLHLENLFTKFY